MGQRRAEAGILGEVGHGAARAQNRIVCSPDDQVDAGLATGGHAEGAGLEGHIDGGAGKPPVTQRRTGLAKGESFRMRYLVYSHQGEPSAARIRRLAREMGFDF